jgi:hypothetical protein
MSTMKLKLSRKDDKTAGGEGSKDTLPCSHDVSLVNLKVTGGLCKPRVSYRGDVGESRVGVTGKKSP